MASGSWVSFAGPCGEFFVVSRTTLQLTDYVEVRREESIPKLFIVIVIFLFHLPQAQTLWSWGWPWTSDSPANPSWVLGRQRCTGIPDLCISGSCYGLMSCPKDTSIQSSLASGSFSDGPKFYAEMRERGATCGRVPCRHLFSVYTRHALVHRHICSENTDRC